MVDVNNKLKKLSNLSSSKLILFFWFFFCLLWLCYSMARKEEYLNQIYF